MERHLVKRAKNSLKKEDIFGLKTKIISLIKMKTMYCIFGRKSAIMKDLENRNKDLKIPWLLINFLITFKLSLIHI